MGTVKLEAKWPPDRKSTIEASEFGIYKVQDDGKHRRMDRASSCLLILSLIAAAVVVVYFTFFDFAIPSVQTPMTGGPVVSYAKYVKDKQTVPGAVDSSTDGLLTALLGVKYGENFTEAPAPVNGSFLTDRMDEDELGNARRTRMYAARQRPALPSYGPGYWKLNVLRGGKYPDGMYGFGRRSDFPQLTAYRAPYPPRGVVNVMKYVTGSPVQAVPDFMVAQESGVRYVPVRAAEDVNRHLPDVAPPKTGSKRFRNRYGPPVYLTPPASAFPDDFMKPPEPDARYSMGFESQVPVDLTVSQGSINVPSHTGVVFHSPPSTRMPVAVKPKKPVKKPPKVKRPVNKKPISVMLDIYPLSDADTEHEQAYSQEEDVQEEEGNDQTIESDSLHDAFTNINQQQGTDNLLFRLNLFPKFGQGGRRISKHLEENKTVQVIHLTTSKPAADITDNAEREETAEK
ncbi:uncharacterized protein LOC126846728 isoform X2 [Adelges cooleyi]|uniref:uncharacterized protein LOC126846728 isoform X2 n=1 Tax=Adelges cooleyi TaxID=133065 RepID=UPI00217FB459|nr:uncharacterized protein LOC126846728 isoform X2 [Adelges cooleyi]